MMCAVKSEFTDGVSPIWGVLYASGEKATRGTNETLFVSTRKFERKRERERTRESERNTRGERKFI